MRTIDHQKEIERIVHFIQQQVAGAGKKNLVVGLSGGIDSALTAALSVRAIGAKHVTGVMLPYKDSHPDSLADAVTVAEQLGIRYHVFEITPMVDGYFKTYHPDADPLRRGNFMARQRMCVLFDLSAKLDALVAGTGNKTELMIGYVTQHGDGACAFEPLGQLYKTEVWALSETLGLPRCVIDKKPTADLWEGQTDEGELGMTYATLDEILFRMLVLKETQPKGFSVPQIEKVKGLITRSEFKRRMPPVPDDPESLDERTVP